MRKEEIQVIIVEEVIIRKIYSVRGKQVMLSQDLAELYEVETKALNQQVKRNIGKFPEKYMFRLNREEYNRLRS
jgi:lauroyl/myristoyl acyltransferase